MCSSMITFRRVVASPRTPPSVEHVKHGNGGSDPAGSRHVRRTFPCSWFAPNRSEPRSVAPVDCDLPPSLRRGLGHHVTSRSPRCDSLLIRRPDDEQTFTGSRASGGAERRPVPAPVSPDPTAPVGGKKRGFFFVTTDARSS